MRTTNNPALGKFLMGIAACTLSSCYQLLPIYDLLRPGGPGETTDCCVENRSSMHNKRFSLPNGPRGPISGVVCFQLPSCISPNKPHHGISPTLAIVPGLFFFSLD